MEDVFNMENESFMQETRLMENEYSVNLPYQIPVWRQAQRRMDQRSQSFPCDHRIGNTGFR